MIKKCLPLILIVTLYGCTDEEGCTDPSALNYNSEATNDNGSCTYATTMIENIKIEFTQTVNGNPLILNDMTYTNQANDNYSIQTVRYLISDITLHTDDNSIILDGIPTLMSMVEDMHLAYLMPMMVG